MINAMAGMTAAARIHHMALIVPACDQRWVGDEVTLAFLLPCGPQFTDGANAVNENSRVVLVQYGRPRALLIGDAEFNPKSGLRKASIST